MLETATDAINIAVLTCCFCSQDPAAKKHLAYIDGEIRAISKEFASPCMVALLPLTDQCFSLISLQAFPRTKQA
jgi:hypothetical protein